MTSQFFFKIWCPKKSPGHSKNSARTCPYHGQGHGIGPGKICPLVFEIHLSCTTPSTNFTTNLLSTLFSKNRNPHNSLKINPCNKNQSPRACPIIGQMVTMLFVSKLPKSHHLPCSPKQIHLQPTRSTKIHPYKHAFTCYHAILARIRFTTKSNCKPGDFPVMCSGLQPSSCNVGECIYLLVDPQKKKLNILSCHCHTQGFWTPTSRTRLSKISNHTTQ